MKIQIHIHYEKWFSFKCDLWNNQRRRDSAKWAVALSSTPIQLEYNTTWGFHQHWGFQSTQSLSLLKNGTSALLAGSCLSASEAKNESRWCHYAFAEMWRDFREGCHDVEKLPWEKQKGYNNEFKFLHKKLWDRSVRSITTRNRQLGVEREAKQVVRGSKAEIQFWFSA